MERFTRVETHGDSSEVLQELERMVTLHTKRSTRVEARRMKRTMTLQKFYKSWNAWWLYMERRSTKRVLARRLRTPLEIALETMLLYNRASL